MKKRALISVSNKDKIVEFAKKLIELDYEIISTGGTKKQLEASGVKCISIDKITGFPEMLDGRVKTLHPKIHGGLLGLRDNKSHLSQLKEHDIQFIDMVVVNLYPFIETVNKPNVSLEEVIENIDIGGPSMLRSAAKNYRSVTVVSDVKDYDLVLKELSEKKSTSLKLREYLAAKVFQLTAHYDAHIAQYLNNVCNITMPDKLTLAYDKKEEMRYGENPHQDASFYVNHNIGLSLSNAEQLQGKKLSYNNIQDANAAIQIMAEFKEAVVVGLKHMNPCGLGTGKTVEEAWDNCYEGDKVSIFGGIVATNQTIDAPTAKKMNTIFLEIIIAPNYTKEALEVFAKKKNLRVLKLAIDYNKRSQWQHTSVNGGVLRQQWDLKNVEDCEIKFATKQKANSQQMEDLLIAQKVVKHVKSNAIVIVKNKQLIGVGAGQMNRVAAAKIALEWCKDKAANAVMASDAFFPFNDVVKLASKYKIAAIIQPGGSIRDKESIEECDKANISMAFTGMRHFKH